MRPGARWVHSGSLGSFRCNVVVVGFVPVQPEGRWVYSGSLGLFKFALGSFWVAGLIRVHLRDATFGVHWVHLGAHWESLWSCEVVGFVWVRTLGVWVHLVSLGSFWCALELIWIH